MTGQHDPPDRELVRPYIKAKDSLGVPGRTLPEPAEPVAEPDAQPADEADETQERAFPAKLLAVLASAALLLGVTGYLAVAPGDDPVPSGSTTVAPPPPPSLPPSPSAAANQRLPTSSPTPAPSRTTSRPGRTPGARPTLSPPPDDARTGPVIAESGRCLTLGGILLSDVLPARVFRCFEIRAQRFTLATDGTLRVAGRCLFAGRTGVVFIARCTAVPAAQWRAGPRGSLVNPASGRCLADPGTAAGLVRTAACTGRDNQRWDLP